MPKTRGDNGALLTVSRNSYLPKKLKHFSGPKRLSKLVVWYEHEPLLFAGGCGKAGFLEKNVFFLFNCFRIFQTDFLPDFLTHKFGVTFSHFLTLPKVCVTFPKCGKSVRKCEEVYHSICRSR